MTGNGGSARARLASKLRVIMNSVFARRWLSIALITAGLFLLPSCSDKSTTGKAAPSPQAALAAMPPVPVTLGVASLKTVPIQVRTIGNGEAYSTVNVKSQVEGKVERVYFEEGQTVKKGQLLFSIDARPFETAVQQAQANLAKDQALEKNAQAQAARYDELFKSGIVSKDQYDQFHTTAASLEASVKADQAAVETGKIQLGYCSIHAPIDGRTGSLMVHQGNTVKANDATLVVINQISPLYVDFSVPEQYLSDIKKYLAQGKLGVQAILPHEEDRPELGWISFVDNSVDRTTGTILLKGTFPNAGNRLWPGQFVNVVITLTEQRNAVVVPSQAVQTGQQGQYIFVVKSDNSVEIRPVVPGAVVGGDEVIEKGIQSGERVVTDGQLMLYPGAHVLDRASASPGGGAPPAGKQ
ncbi:MAG TPA: efflux RND transporter periplasmic adaptor subunit [Terriglobia bacterium]|nr:efflux RND transporter periplasmic adaptor subunit [Terriglobia bacterium]